MQSHMILFSYAMTPTNNHHRQQRDDWSGTMAMPFQPPRQTQGIQDTSVPRSSKK